MQLVFEARINLAEIALKKIDLSTFKDTVELIKKDINSLPEETIAVKEKWKEKASILSKGVIDQFKEPTMVYLKMKLLH